MRQGPVTAVSVLHARKLRVKNEHHRATLPVRSITAVLYTISEIPSFFRKELTPDGACVSDRRAQGCARDRMDAGLSETQAPSGVGVALPEMRGFISSQPGSRTFSNGSS